MSGKLAAVERPVINVTHTITNGESASEVESLKIVLRNILHTIPDDEITREISRESSIGQIYESITDDEISCEIAIAPEDFCFHFSYGIRDDNTAMEVSAFSERICLNLPEMGVFRAEDKGAVKPCSAERFPADPFYSVRNHNIAGEVSAVTESTVLNISQVRAESQSSIEVASLKCSAVNSSDIFWNDQITSERVLAEGLIGNRG